jgi:hypothetical protein
MAGQIGQEATAALYVDAISEALAEWRRVLRPTGSVFLNVGDTYWRRSLAGIPYLIEQAARSQGWIIRNRIVWSKSVGMPEPARDRLASRHEYVLHLASGKDYYYDLFGYSAAYGNGANPGDVWSFGPGRSMNGHLAPFPPELVQRVITLACPEQVCAECGQPRRRIVERTMELDMERPQARRALEIATKAHLTAEHIQAIQSFGISDTGKATRVQTGTGKSSERVTKLAQEAKAVLNGYFREFTFAKRQSVGWTDCGHEAFEPATVLDPFAGTGTTLRVANELGRNAVGVDLDPLFTTAPGELTAPS